MIKAIVKAVVITVIVFSSLLWATAHQMTGPMPDKPATGEAALMARCSPTSGIPGHVVIVPEGKSTPVFTGSQRLIHEALEQEFNNGKTHHVIYGFCK